jgi:hypothetical protein
MSGAKGLARGYVGVGLTSRNDGGVAALIRRRALVLRTEPRCRAARSLTGFDP